MRCTNCDYALWNLTARECPECGSRFAPSEFEFVAGSVQFCCPHCQQVYYGTGDSGHLQPVEFDCVSCGRHVHMDEMLLRPAEGLEDRDTKIDDVPWLERKRIGFFKGWFGTVWKSLIAPHRLMNAVPAQNSTPQAWWFMLVTIFLSTTVSFGIWILFFLLIDVLVSGPGVGFGIMLPMIMTGYWIACLLAIVVFTVVWGLTAHGLLRLTGATHDTIGRTYGALCFASGSFVLMAMPCFGVYIAMPWWVVAGVLMVCTAQRVSGWRATLAVVTFPVLSWLLIAGAYVGLIAFMMPAMAGGMATARVVTQTNTVQMGLLQYAAANQGDGPRHVVELIDGHAVPSDRFILPGSYTQMTATPIGDSNLYDLAQAAPVEFDRMVMQAIDAMPEDVIAYRLGDFVFTYSGIDLRGREPDLWVFITCADPDQNESAAIDGTFHVGKSGWGSDTISFDQFDDRLEQQNRLRQRHGLQPLPHPWRVTHGRPAVAGSEAEPAGR